MSGAGPAIGLDSSQLVQLHLSTSFSPPNHPTWATSLQSGGRVENKIPYSRLCATQSSGSLEWLKKSWMFRFFRPVLPSRFFRQRDELLVPETPGCIVFVCSLLYPLGVPSVSRTP